MKAWLLPVVASLGAGVVMAQETNSVTAANVSTSAAPAAVVSPAPEAPAAPAPAVVPETVLPPESAATNEPAKPAAKKVKKAAPKVQPVILSHNLVQPPVTAVTKVENLNVRSHPSTTGDVITKLKKGETVTVLEDITVKVKKGEPATWARITLPANTPVWVAARLISSNNTVVPARMNVRSGPGENFDVIGHLEKGATVKELRKKNGWLEIEAPADASAYIAAGFIEKQTSAPVAPTSTEVIVPPVAAPAPEPLPAPEIVVVTPDTNDVVMPAVDPTPEPAPAPEPVAVAPVVPAVVAPAAPIQDEILPKRIVNREGILRKSLNIQAPADYELRDMRTGELLDYLSPLKPDLDMKPFIGVKVIVTGEEALDVRWKFTPLIKVESIEAL